jgi:hypothetical protein
MSVIFLFIDGAGLGDENPENPLTNGSLKGFSFISGGKPLAKNARPVYKKNHLFVPVDAALDVEGLPQSGTGQAALFTGVNAAKTIGKHFGPYPHSGIKPVLKKQSLFKKAQQKGAKCTFINAYPDAFFQQAKKRNRWTCTTFMAKSAGISLKTEQDVKNGAALTADITQESWQKRLKLDVPAITPEKAAERLINQSAHYDLLLHEYYLTDKAGHSQQPEMTEKYLGRYDRFLWKVIQIKPENITIVLCSDHGNIEDISTKTHTLNKVPLFVYGPGAEIFHPAKSIMDVTPGILEIFLLRNNN